MLHLMAATVVTVGNLVARKANGVGLPTRAVWAVGLNARPSMTVDRQHMLVVGVVCLVVAAAKMTLAVYLPVLSCQYASMSACPNHYLA